MLAQPIQAEEDDWERARQRWADHSGRRAALLQQKVGRELALSIAKSDSHPPRCSETLFAIAAPYLAETEQDRDKAVVVYLALCEEIARSVPSWYAEGQRFAGAQRTETDRRARELQPRYKKAAAELADAIDALSTALVRERNVREELGPLSESRCLPSIGGEIEAWVGTLEQRHGPLWTTREKIRELKILGDGK